MENKDMENEKKVEERFIRVYEESIQQAQQFLKKGETHLARYIREMNRVQADYKKLQLDYVELEKKYTALTKPEGNRGQSQEQRDFLKEGSWTNRLRYIIRKENKPLTALQITELYPKYDPDYGSKYYDLRNSIQHALCSASKDELLIMKRVPKSRAVYYCLAGFLDKTGELKPEYRVYKD